MRRKSPTVLHSVAVVVVLDISWLTRGTGRQRGGDTGAVCLHQNEFESCHLYIFASAKELIGVISGKEQVIMHKKK